MAAEHSFVQKYHNSFNPSLLDGHIGYVQFGALIRIGIFAHVRGISFIIFSWLNLRSKMVAWFLNAHRDRAGIPL